MALQEQTEPTDHLHRARMQARQIISNPDAADSPSARRLAWLIEASTRGACISQRHRNPARGAR